jgi:hypothetical protein
MALKINGTTIVDDSRNYSTTDSVQHGGAIIISDILTLAGEGYKAADGNKVITDQGIAFNNYVVEDGSILLKVQPVFQGTIAGYASGGYTNVDFNIIEKFSFVSDGNASDVGDLTQNRRYTAGQSSDVSGYNSGGARIGFPNSNVIDKFPFAVDVNATDVGDLTGNAAAASGHSSRVTGYISASNNGAGNISQNSIDKFLFASDGTSVNIANMGVGKFQAAGQSSEVSGYISGGDPTTSSIDKFPFAVEDSVSAVGSLTVEGGRTPAGQSSAESGYTSGGGYATRLITIDKFPFASDANATDVGDLTLARHRLSGQSSTTSGYTCGGANINVIDKFSFTSDGNATDVGNLTVGRYYTTGQQI